MTKENDATAQGINDGAFFALKAVECSCGDPTIALAALVTAAVTLARGMQLVRADVIEGVTAAWSDIQADEDAHRKGMH